MLRGIVRRVPVVRLLSVPRGLLLPVCWVFWLHLMLHQNVRGHNWIDQLRLMCIWLLRGSDGPF